MTRSQPGRGRKEYSREKKHKGPEEKKMLITFGITTKFNETVLEV